MAERTLYLCIATKDVDRSIAELKKLGVEAERVGKTIAESQEPASKALSALDAVTGQLRGRMQGFADELGPLGAGLSRLGVAGIAAGAAVGSAVAAIAQLSRVAEEAATKADTLADAAGRARLPVDQYQALTIAADHLGAEHGVLDAAMAKFSKTLGEAKLGSKEAEITFKALGVAAGETVPTFYDVIDSIGQIKDTALQDAVSMRIFGKSFAEIRPLIGATSTAIREQAAAAQAHGLVIEEHTVKALAEYHDHLEDNRRMLEKATSEMVESHLPALVQITDAIRDTKIEFLEWTGTIADWIAKLDDWGAQADAFFARTTRIRNRQHGASGGWDTTTGDWSLGASGSWGAPEIGTPERRPARTFQQNLALLREPDKDAQRAADEAKRLVEANAKVIDSLKAEYAQLGMTAEERARDTAVRPLNTSATAEQVRVAGELGVAIERIKAARKELSEDVEEDTKADFASV